MCPALSSRAYRYSTLRCVPSTLGAQKGFGIEERSIHSRDIRVCGAVVGLGTWGTGSGVRVPRPGSRCNGVPRHRATGFLDRLPDGLRGPIGPIFLPTGHGILSDSSSFPIYRSSGTYGDESHVDGNAMSTAAQSIWKGTVPVAPVSYTHLTLPTICSV